MPAAGDLGGHDEVRIRIPGFLLKSRCERLRWGQGA